jgi:hypothetical protein
MFDPDPCAEKAIADDPRGDALFTFSVAYRVSPGFLNGVFRGSWRFSHEAGAEFLAGIIEAQSDHLK